MTVLQSGVFNRLKAVKALPVLFYWAVRFAGEQNEAHDSARVFARTIVQTPLC